MKLESSCMKVGNSLAVIVPKNICLNYKLSKGDKITFLTTDKGIFIPLKLIPTPKLGDLKFD